MQEPARARARGAHADARTAADGTGASAEQLSRACCWHFLIIFTRYYGFTFPARGRGREAHEQTLSRRGQSGENREKQRPRRGKLFGVGDDSAHKLDVIILFSIRYSSTRHSRFTPPHPASCLLPPSSVVPCCPVCEKSRLRFPPTL